MKKLPRGFRNKNPLNIRHGLSHWKGSIRDSTDRSFVVFESMMMGYRAAWKMMHTYQVKLEEKEMKPFNIHNTIRRWAPPNENNTNAYIKRVVELSGIPEFQKLTPPEIKGDDVMKVMTAMTCVENGIEMSLVPTDDIRKGYFAAFPDGWLEKDIRG